jgi:hypothetical protein
VGFFFVPPVYPTRVRTTPLRLPNRESAPQNHPTAKVAVSVFAGAAASMGGIAVFGNERVMAVSFPISLFGPVPSHAGTIRPKPRQAIAIPAGKILLKIVMR